MKIYRILILSITFLIFSCSSETETGGFPESKMSISSEMAMMEDVRISAPPTSLGNEENKDSVLKRLALSHELCRQYALRNKYDYILHLETDVFPPVDVIERLMVEGKDIVGALYQLSDDGARIPMLNRISSNTDDYRVAIYGGYNNFMIDGKVKQTLSAGLGCVLIKKKRCLRSVIT